jgi:hypothetical protein
LTSGAREFVWHAHVVSPQTPWVGVVIPDGALTQRREIISGPQPPAFRGTTGR